MTMRKKLEQSRRKVATWRWPFSLWSRNTTITLRLNANAFARILQSCLICEHDSRSQDCPGRFVRGGII